MIQAVRSPTTRRALFGAALALPFAVSIAPQALAEDFDPIHAAIGAYLATEEMVGDAAVALDKAEFAANDFPLPDCLIVTLDRHDIGSLIGRRTVERIDKQAYIDRWFSPMPHRPRRHAEMTAALKQWNADRAPLLAEVERLDAELDEARDARGDAWDRLLKMTPTSTEGLARKIEVMADAGYDDMDDWKVLAAQVRTMGIA